MKFPLHIFSFLLLSPSFLTHWPITAKFYRLVEVLSITMLLQMSFFLWALKNLPRAQPCNMVPAVGRALLEASAVRYHWAGVADSQEATSLVPGFKELHVLYQLAAIPVFVAWLTLGLCLVQRSVVWGPPVGDWTRSQLTPRLGSQKGTLGMFVLSLPRSNKQTNLPSVVVTFKISNFCYDIFILGKIDIQLNSFSKQKQS